MLVEKQKQKENFQEKRLVFDHGNAHKGPPEGTLEDVLAKKFDAHSDVGPRLADTFRNGGPDKEAPGLVKATINGLTGGVRSLVGGALEGIEGIVRAPVNLAKGVVRRGLNVIPMAPAVTAGAAGKLVGEAGILTGKIIKPVTGTITKVYETLTEAIPNLFKSVGRKIKPAKHGESNGNTSHAANHGNNHKKAPEKLPTTHAPHTEAKIGSDSAQQPRAT